MAKYTGQQLWMLVDLNDAVGESAKQMNCSPRQVFITVAFVSNKLGISRYHAKKFMEQLVHIGVYIRQGNRYLFNVESVLFMSLCTMAEGY